MSAPSTYQSGWLAPALLSVGVHALAVLGVVGLSGLVEPPRPVALVPVEIAFEAAPAAAAAAEAPLPAMPAPPPAAEKAAPPPASEQPVPPEPETVEAPPPPAVTPEPVAAVTPVALPVPPPSPRIKPDPPMEAAPVLKLLAETAVKKAPPSARPSDTPSAQEASLPADTAPAASTAPVKPQASAPGYGLASLGNPPPRYPSTARRRGLEGRVVLRVHVDADGTANRVEVMESSGHALLDRAARRAVLRWRFVPARLAGVPVTGTVDVPVTFRLKD